MKRIVIAVYLVAIHLILIYFTGDRLISRYLLTSPVTSSGVHSPTEDQPIATPLPVPETFADSNTNSDTGNAAAPSPAIALQPGLIIPVVGVTPDQLIDTFSASRSEGKYHDAIDIMAPAGTPVVAAADGEIARFFDSERGGITIYQLTTDRNFVLYYAHLQRRDEAIRIGTTVKKGATIAYVGDTGNAGSGNFHLHFSIARVTDPKRIWDGTYLNPYPFLMNGTYPDIP